jgi:hypothetical protein
MDRDRKDDLKEFVKDVHKLEATEAAIQHEIRDFIGEPNTSQRQLLEDLARLRRSLRGPEEVLDKGSYSRPFPPRPLHRG